MTGHLVICHAQAVLPDGIMPDACVCVRDGTIVSILAAGSRADDERGACEVDAGGGWLVPGFIDLHIHGLHRHLAEEGPAAVAADLVLLDGDLQVRQTWVAGARDYACEGEPRWY